MIKNKLKSQKGISLITLSITVIVLMVVTNAIIYNSKDNLVLERLKNMQSDVSNLKEKVSDYYIQYGTIPVLEREDGTFIEYTNLDDLRDKNVGAADKEEGIISDIADIGKFYVIDISLLDNLTLNFGEDYKKVKANLSMDVNELRDIYIINETSHNVFYVRGMQVDEETYYTDYSVEEKDNAPVDIRNVGGIEIPAGYKYVSGSGADDLIICDKNDESKRYQWFTISKSFDGINDPLFPKIENDVEKKYDLLNSANVYMGYFINKSNGIDVAFVEPKWSPKYDKTSEYRDKNGDVAVIPAKFQVSMDSDKNTINNGLVVKAPDGSEFVWIPVNKETFEYKFKRTASYKELEGEDKMKFRGEANRNGENQYLQKNGILESEETRKESQNMYKSVKQNGGFYIGRFEAGRYTTTEINVESKRGLIPYTNIKWGNSMVDDKGGAVEIVRNMDEKDGFGDVSSTMCYGVQWDAIMNFIDPDYITNEVEGKPNCKENSAIIKDWQNLRPDMENTGIYEECKLKNIYDLAGNAYEMTMESSGLYARCLRGDTDATSRYLVTPDRTDLREGFRPALYINNI